MAENFITPSNTIDLRLPQSPDVTDPVLFRELSIVYTALRQLHNSVDKFFDIPAEQQTGPYNINYLDRGKTIQTEYDVNIPKESDIGYKFPLGATISIINTSNSTINITTSTGVTLILAGAGETGDRTLDPWGLCAVRKIATDTWIIIGAGLDGIT